MADTFDQKLKRKGSGQLFDPETTAPDVALKTTLVLEPNTHQGVARVRVTARDEKFNVLWGANVSEGILNPDSQTEVGFYSTLRGLIREHLPRERERFETTDAPYESIQRSVRTLSEYCSAIEDGTIKVKKKSTITTARAEAVADVLLDTLRTWSQSLREAGIKRTVEAEGKNAGE